MEIAKASNPPGFERRKVFIVHGHDSAALNELEITLRRWEFNPVSLGRTVSYGSQSIIDKFEREANVSFAIILMTPDDEGKRKGQSALQPRARQNVVFELGYFFSKLGRGRVICLLKKGLELPSDISGVIYIPFAKKISEAELRLRAELLESTFPDPVPTGTSTFESTSSPDFIGYLERAIRSARHIAVIATGVNEPLMKLIRGATPFTTKEKCDLEFFVADPDSPFVEQRLIEEELGDFKPPVGFSGLRSRIDTLRELKTTGSHSFQLGLFAHYPTFALIIVDDDYFMYPYGYAALGTFSPVLKFSRKTAADRSMIKFLDDHYQRVKAAVVDVDTVFAARSSPYPKIDHLMPFAVFFIPSAASELYRFGTSVLGYDVRGQKIIHSRWGAYTGGAANFGFHLTICDALFFYTENEIRWVSEEVTFLAMRFKQFELHNPVLQPGFPNANSVAISVEEDTGSLEALHQELVFRVYRRAAASNYTAHIATPDRDSKKERAQNMIARYRAPYIMRSFRPHFTLLTELAPKHLRVQKQLETLFSKTVHGDTFLVDRLSIMSREKDSGRWFVVQEILLR